LALLLGAIRPHSSCLHPSSSSPPKISKYIISVKDLYIISVKKSTILSFQSFKGRNGAKKEKITGASICIRGLGAEEIQLDLSFIFNRQVRAAFTPLYHLCVDSEEALNWSAAVGLWVWE
jgi:hypothetical protein